MQTAQQLQNRSSHVAWQTRGWTRNRSAVGSGDELYRTGLVYVAVDEGDAERLVVNDAHDLSLIQQALIIAAPPGSEHALTNFYRTTKHLKLLDRHPTAGPRVAVATK